MTMSEQSQQSDLFPMELESMSSQEDFPAKTSPSRDTKQALKANAVDSGQSAPVLLGSFDPDTPSLKTSQTCLMENGELGLSEYSGTFPRSGMMRNGTVYQLPNLARTITEIGSGLFATQEERFYWRTPDTGSGGTPKALLEGETHRKSGSAIQVRLGDQVKMWPTPTVATIHASMQAHQKEAERLHPKGQNTLGAEVASRMWPTPTANEDAAGTPKGKMQKMLGNHPSLRGNTPEQWSRGTLNPTWVEWLMGFPIGHTDLNA